ncbi:ATP-binding protein [Chryseobacterium gwangjuense]|uniref:ATP-binding protein n=1 Tax=Chryseobacterium gwangjuense TaxID=1069980 RepID=UPI001E33E8DE|nr:ATP-binding protein [Chryseobacterium gwangjuense]MCE3076329.1 ATP-binding protein [Chryseobacterium gwangjuense]
MKSIRLILLIFLFNIQFHFSQNIKHLSVEEGLPQSFVSAIEQDEDGFMWISTRNGLARYDGNSFRIFQHDLKNKNSLSSNIIDYIKKDRQNTLLIKYETNEIDRFDLKTEKAEHIINAQFIEKNHISVHRNTWLVSRDNVLWFKSKENNLYHYHLNNKSKLVKHNLSLTSDEKIFNIAEDKNSNIWVLTQKNLKQFNRKTQHFINIPIPYTMFKDDTESKVFESIAFSLRKNGEFLWADKENLYFFNPLKKVFRTEKLPISSPVKIKWIVSNPNGKEYFIAGNNIYSHDDISGINFLSTITINKKTQAFYVDHSGLVWVGADTDGIYTIDYNVNFEAFSYKKDFITDLLKETYGISLHDFFDWDEQKLGVLQPSYYFRSAWNHQKEWIALNRTICYYDTKEKKVFKFPTLPMANEAGFSFITGISLDQDKPFVIDKLNTIYTFNNGKWEVFQTLKNFNPALKSTNIYFDLSAKALWITTESHGLIKIDVSSKSIRQIINDKTGLPTNHLVAAVPDSRDKNILWLGSINGLIRFNKTTGKSRIFTVKDGLPDQVIYSILQDQSGNLWMGTNKGLVKFDTQNFNIRVFTRQHGLKNIEFNRFHQFLLQDGRMFFGGTENGVKFNPEKIKQDIFSPVTAITQILINNKENIINNSTVNHVQELILHYSENTVSITFAALQFSQPQETRYRYRLKGYQDDWVYTKNHEINYIKLPPGKYIFEVNASNTSGKWSHFTKSLPIKISPPWWKTWWAIIIYLLLIGSSIIWFIRFKIKQEIIKNEIKLKQKEALELRKLDAIKNNFFSNIAHEFRTPLSLILGPAEQLKTESVSEDRNKLFDTIKKNTGSLIQLTDQLIDIAKLEAGVLTPQMVWGDAIMVISQVVNAFSEEAFTKKISLTLEAPAKAECLFSINTLDRILYNLISNALKFCSAGDHITVKVSHNENGLLLKVQDTGSGIPDEEQHKIFTRYFKGTQQDELQGNGIGLSLVKELVELHQGTIDLESTTSQPSGTIFSIWLPLESQKNTNTNPKHKNETLADNFATLLIVEDNKDLSQFLTDNLRDSYTIFVAENGKQALDIALEKMPDLILSDVVMNEMDGFEFCKTLKNNININHIPVILLTAKADMESKIEGLSYGANDYIIKPFSITELKYRISNQLLQQKKQYEYLKNTFLLPETEVKEIEIQENSITNSINNDFLNKIHKIIEEHLDNKDFSVDELATALSMSRSNLHRKVKAMFDMPTGEIIKTYRLKRASELLKQNYTISEVTYMTGFNTPSYFTKCFKEYFGHTPTEHL